MKTEQLVWALEDSALTSATEACDWSWPQALVVNRGHSPPTGPGFEGWKKHWLFQVTWCWHGFICPKRNRHLTESEAVQHAHLRLFKSCDPATPETDPLPHNPPPWTLAPLWFRQVT